MEQKKNKTPREKSKGKIDQKMSEIFFVDLTLVFILQCSIIAMDNANNER